MTFFTLRNRHADAASPAPQVVRDALVMLGRTGCALCRVPDSSTETWTRWFVIESHTDGPTLSRFKGALGCYAAHTRHLVALAAPPIPLSPWEWVLGERSPTRRH